MSEVSKLDIIRTKKSTAEGKVIPADALVLVDPEFPANKVLGTDANGNIVATDGGASFASLTGQPTDNANLSTALSGKQATITGGASTIATVNLTVNRALISSSSGKVAVSDVTNTELGYLDGVTSNVQTQLDSKLQNTSTGTGTVINGTASGGSSTVIGGSSTASISATAIGKYAKADGNSSIVISGSVSEAKADTSATYCVVIGESASCTRRNCVAIGANANTRGAAGWSIQIGQGTNSEDNTMYVGLSASNNYKLLGSDGKIPAERLNVPNIQVVSALPASPVEGVIYIVTGS